MAPWIWDDAAKTTFLQEFETSIEGAWSAKHQFHCSKEFWTDLGARVDVRVVVKDGAQSGDDHMNVVSYKESPNTIDSTPAHVAATEILGSHDADDNEMVVNSQHTRRRRDIAQSKPVSFTAGTNTLTGAGDRRPELVRQRLQERRRAALQLVQARDRRGRHRAGQREPGRRGARTARSRWGPACSRSSPRTRPATCSAWATSTPRRSAARAAGWARRSTPTSARRRACRGVAENSDSITSVGDAVCLQHYATFLEALKAVTTMAEWVYGPPVPVTAPNPALEPVRNDGTGPAVPSRGPPLPEPGGDVLVEMDVEGHQDDPWTRRVSRDGAVWTHSNLRTWIEDGEVRQEHRPPAWERVTTAPPEALERIEQVMREHDLLHAPAVQRPAGTVTGVGVTT